MQYVHVAIYYNSFGGKPLSRPYCHYATCGLQTDHPAELANILFKHFRVDEETHKIKVRKLKQKPLVSMAILCVDEFNNQVTLTNNLQYKV